MILRASLLGLITLFLVAATFPDAFTVPDEEQFLRNYERWSSMSVEKREGYRALWSRYQAYTEIGRERLVARWSTLQRIRARATPGASSEGAGPVDPAALLDALHGELQRAVSVVRTRVRAGAGDPAEARRALQQLNRERIGAFLGSLVEGGLLAEAERDALLGLDPDELYQHCLKLRKQELLMWIEEGQPELARELRHLDPLETEERARQQRRERGFFGPVGRLVDRRLNEDTESRRRLQQAYDVDDQRAVRRILDPHVRAVLANLDVSPDRIDGFLKLPHAQLERHLNAMVLEERKAPTRETVEGVGIGESGESDDAAGPEGAAGPTDGRDRGDDPDSEGGRPPRR